MKSNSKRRIGLTYLIFGVVIVISFAAVRATIAAEEPVHLVTDWSHRHVLFSAPHSLMDQLRLSRNPRYIQQVIRRNAELKDQGDGWPQRDLSEHHKYLLRGDWSINMGTGATVGAGNYPAKFSFNAGTASCSDFVVYNTSLAGSSTQASVVAFDNLYAGRCGAAPSTYWAFNTGGTVVTSVVLSLDGSQVAFVQNNSPVTQATLVLLKWAANSGTIGSSDTLTAVSNALYPACTAPCMTTIPFSLDNGASTKGDTLSSPFYDYTGDILYVGDGNGYLHKFTSVFLSTGTAFPAETISNSANVWPALTSMNSPLNNPVYDQDTGWIFVGSLFGTLKRVNAVVGGGTGANIIVKTNQMDLTNVNFDGPLLDSTNGVIYLVVSKSAPITGQSSGVSALYTFPVNFLTGANGVQTVLSTDGPNTAIYLGAFDNQWFLGNAGHMYACASAASAGNNVPTLYQIPVSTTGVLGSVSTGPALSSAASGSPLCSPVTAYFNSSNTSGGLHPAGTDLIFLSVTNFGQTTSPISCPSNLGCLMSFDVTSGAAISSSTQTVATTHEAGGTSGIIVDGSSASVGASQIYFNPLTSTTCGTGGTGGCAIQASQSTLN